ncbi:hypothetical protein PybrP1_007687 [[Pythium] brassicae (nom. inval.)]|nr:hypothetical protein PybrP1_007687 [[Pythium] brassicae (nom. inval.)]
MSGLLPHSCSCLDTLNQQPIQRRRNAAADHGRQGVAIVFLFGCGGLADSGEIVIAGGPLIGRIAIAVYPIVMTVPYGYIVTELSSAFRQDGGFTVRVMHVVGAFWALQIDTWSWVIGVLSCAIVPGEPAVWRSTSSSIASTTPESSVEEYWV